MTAFDKASKANTILSLASRAWDFAKLLGIDGQLTALLWFIAAGVWALLAKFWHMVPVWLGVVAGVVFATYCTKLYTAIKIARSIRGVKTFDLSRFADECLAYYRDFSSFAVSRADARPVPMIANSSADIRQEWAKGVEHSNRSRAMVIERFAARAVAIVHQFDSLGIPQPPLRMLYLGDAGSVSVYIGAVGELLSKGQLAEARKLDPDSTWGVVSY